MTDVHYAQGVTAENLRIFFDLWPRIAAEFEDMKRMLIDDQKIIFGKDAIPFSWCHLYELPIKELMVLPMAGFFTDEKFVAIVKDMIASPSQIAALPNVIGRIGHYMDALENPSKEEVNEFLPLLGVYLGASFAVFNSLRSASFITAAI